MEASDADNAALMEHLERTLPTMNLADAEHLLRDVKQVLDEHGVVFFLRQGTCLGAIREHALIPWDDDMDLGSILGMHGFKEEMIEPAVEGLRAKGCYVEVHPEGLYTSVKIMRSRIRIDWQCYRVVKGTIAHYPGVPFPVSLFKELTEVDFIGDRYLVPSPPEEYLRYKYGPEWRTPKQVGYEKDVLDNMPTGTVPGHAGWLKQFLAVHFSPGQSARLLVLDEQDNPVDGAQVVVAGLNRSRTNRSGIVRFYLPGPDTYAVAITANGREEVLYEEALSPGKMYVYRPDTAKPAGRYFALTEA